MASHYLPKFVERVGVYQRAACGALILAAGHSTEPNCEPCSDYVTSERLAMAVVDNRDARAKGQDHK